MISTCLSGLCMVFSKVIEAEFKSSVLLCSHTCMVNFVLLNLLVLRLRLYLILYPRVLHRLIRAFSTVNILNVSAMLSYKKIYVIICILNFVGDINNLQLPYRILFMSEPNQYQGPAELYYHCSMGGLLLRCKHYMPI